MTLPSVTYLIDCFEAISNFRRPLNVLPTMNLRENIIAVIRLEPFERETFTEIYRINRESHNYPCNDAEKEQQFVAFVLQSISQIWAS